MPRPLSIFLSTLVILGLFQPDCLLLAQPPKEITNSIGMKLVLIPKVLESVVALACVLAVVSFVWITISTGRNRIVKLVTKQLEPLGFTVIKSFEPEDRERFYSFLNDGLWMLHSPVFVAVSESDGVRIVAAEFIGADCRLSFIMGSTKNIKAPSMIIRRNSAGSKFMGIANLDEVRFAEDQEFQEMYVVRGRKKDQIRGFLTPQRRKAILDEPGFFTGLGISGDSILIEYSRLGVEKLPEEVDKYLAMTRVVERMCQKG